MTERSPFSFYALLALVFLLPIFFIPSVGVPFVASKIILIALCTLLAFLALAIAVLREDRITLPSSKILWAVLLFPLAYFLSSLGSVSKSLSLFGYNFEVGTLGFIILGVVLLGIIPLIFTNRAQIFRAYGALLLSSSLLALFALIKILSQGKFLVFGVFANTMDNPVGNWTDYALIFGLVATLALFALESLALKKFLKVLIYSLLFLSLFFMAVINYATAWILLLSVSLVALVYFLTARGEPEMAEVGSKRKVSRLTLTVFLISLLFVLNPTISATRGGIGNVVSNAFNVQNVDVRPSIAATLNIAKSSLKKSALLGTGPNTFGLDWSLYKPVEVNGTNFWNVPFPFGIGFIPTEISSLGLLGTLLWLLFFVIFLRLGGRALSIGGEKKSDRFLVVSLFVASLYLWASAFVSVPSVVVLTLAFVFTGLFLSALVATGALSTRTVVFSNSVVLNFVSALVIIVLAIGGVAFGFVAYEKVASAIYFQEALNSANDGTGSLDTIEAKINKAINLSPSDVHYRFFSQLFLARAQSVVADDKTPIDTRRQNFQTAITESVGAAQTATKINPSNYLNWLTLGGVYEALVPAPLSVKGAYESAKAAYEEAGKDNPKSPEIELVLGRLEFANGGVDNARDHIKEALALKQDYADAYFFLTQLEASQNNIDEAITSAQTATILSPDNAGIFFELGLLKYYKRDYTGASEALAQAITLVPGYANAQYFLGLSLDKLGRHAEAITQFENLTKTNPDNQDIVKILANLHVGKDALYKLAPPSPEARATLPITGTNQ